MAEQKQEPTLLIIGAGTFGTSLAVHASKAYRDASRITIVDRWSPDGPVQDKQAAAIDINRIIRTDYTSPLYCNLANEAIHFWFWGMEVQGHFHKAGWTVFDGPDQSQEFRSGVRKTFEERGSNVIKQLDANDLIKEQDVLKGLDGDKLGKGYFNPEAGWVDAASATKAYLRIAESRGVKRVTGEVNELLLRDNGEGLAGVRLHDGTVLKADKVVVAAGAWTSSLLSPLEDKLDIADKDRIERQITAVGRLSAYYDLSESESKHMMETKLPIVVIGGEVDIIPPYYHLPCLKINDLKTEFTNTIITASGRRITTPSTRNQMQVPKKLTQESEKVLKNSMPGWTKSRSPDRWRICYDAVTPTEDWVLSRHPDNRLKNMYIAVGGSFHSYKFMPNAGSYLLNVIEGKSNGEEKDRAWKWKSEDELKERCAKEFGNSPRNEHRRELSDFEEEKARL
ncbi:fructosyl amino acid oxidasesarcosine oxidase [Boeremia exigua]|uniref:fructosyl amino acid oxidasesarcosine oxidase n=1 Tax=Boeremia exigua TaxID=749465 RepID=UPI001E8E2F46|nr:fructosyl amino acid oxidasesarcosine oxidase [Boeremia exigua]KAH6632936.1 fructosyl amino acid oxidasesarcosine oxidase [Boeremia exigua]